MARRNASEQKSVNPDLAAAAIAKCICDGDIVNLRLLFGPFSPARANSTEHFETDKYAYLLPDDTLRAQPAFTDWVRRVREPGMWAYITGELEANRPARLPHELVMALADNAVRAEKYTSAAQAYEMLRVRGRMQEVFLAAADRALDAGDIPRAVRGYLVATGLDYDYAAFPEPQPAIPDFQTRALMLHGEYPLRAEDCFALQETDAFVSAALAYLLLSPGAAARLDSRPVETRARFLAELVRRRDPQWDAFAERYRAACDKMRAFADRIARSAEESRAAGDALQRDIEEQLGDDPRSLPTLLLGRDLGGAEWWQYLKELAFSHPAGVLFVARQMVGDVEILVPRYRADSPLPGVLGLAVPAA
jgi:hypothetical protein